MVQGGGFGEAGRVPRTVRSQVCLVLAVALLARLVMLHGMVLPARDAFKYLDAAELLSEAPFPDSVRMLAVHPLYPGLLSLVQQTLWAVGVESGATWFFWGSLANIAVSLLWLTLGFLMMRRLFDARMAVWGSLLLAVLPRTTEYSVDLLADMLHACLWAGCVLLLAREWTEPVQRESSDIGDELEAAGWRRWGGRLAARLGAGACAGLAYLTHLQAFALGAVVLAAVGWSVLPIPGLTRWPLRRAVAVVLSFGLGWAAVVGPYAATIGGLTPRLVGPIFYLPRTAGAHFGYQSVAETVAALEQSQVEAAVARGQALPPEPPTAPSVYLRRGLIATAAVWLKELAEEFRGWPVLAAFAGIGLFVQRRRPGLALLVGVAVAYAALAFMMGMRSGYIAGRYLLPTFPVLAGLAVTGVPVLLQAGLVLAQRIQQRFRRADSAPIALQSSQEYWLVAALAALTLALTVPRWFEPLHANQAGHLAAADWLRQHTDAAEVVLDPGGCATLLSNRPAWRERDADRLVDLRYAILDDRLVPHTTGTVRPVVLYAVRYGERIAQFAPPGSRHTVSVYRLPTISAAQLARIQTNVPSSERR